MIYKGHRLKTNNQQLLQLYLSAHDSASSAAGDSDVEQQRYSGSNNMVWSVDCIPMKKFKKLLLSCFNHVSVPHHLLCVPTYVVWIGSIFFFHFDFASFHFSFHRNNKFIQLFKYALQSNKYFVFFSFLRVPAPLLKTKWFGLTHLTRLLEWNDTRAIECIQLPCLQMLKT